MSGPTKKPRIKSGRKTSKKDSKAKAVKSKRKVSKTGSPTVSWQKTLGHLTQGIPEVGLYLKGLRKREGLTQKELAAALSKESKVLQHHISEMERGKRPISKKMARRLAKILGADYRMFL